MFPTTYRRMGTEIERNGTLVWHVANGKSRAIARDAYFNSTGARS